MRGYMRHGDLSLAVQVGDRFLPWDPEYHARLSEVVELGLGPGGIVVFSVTFTHNKLAFDVTTPWSDPIGFLCPACYTVQNPPPTLSESELETLHDLEMAREEKHYNAVVGAWELPGSNEEHAVLDELIHDEERRLEEQEEQEEQSFLYDVGRKHDEVGEWFEQESTLRRWGCLSPLERMRELALAHGDYTAHPDFDPHDFSTDK